MITYPAMNSEIVRLLRVSDDADKRYAALRIEELERYCEECQKVINVLLEALEIAKWIIEKNTHSPVAGYSNIVDAIQKARGDGMTVREQLLLNAMKSLIRGYDMMKKAHMDPRVTTEEFDDLMGRAKAACDHAEALILDIELKEGKL